MKNYKKKERTNIKLKEDIQDEENYKKKNQYTENYQENSLN